MKISLLAFAVLIGFKSMAQTIDEKKVLELSNKIFQYEVEGKTDSLTNLFDDDLRVVTSRGDVQSKNQYTAILRSNTFSHDSINVEQSKVSLVENTAVVIGRGMFHMTISGNKLHRHLSFMEVFVFRKKTWKLVALYASVIPD
jgi:hypothetical protein